MSGRSGKVSRSPHDADRQRHDADRQRHGGPATRVLEWVLDADQSAGEALRRFAPHDARALAEGRLFVRNHRVGSENERLQAGDMLTLRSARTTVERAPSELVIDRREGLIAAAKPAAWSSEPDRTGNLASLRERLALQLGLTDVHVATRLDVGVSGLVLAAINPAARRYLANLVGTKDCHRSYLAAVAGAAPDSGCWQSSVETEPRGKSSTAITNFETIVRVALEPGVRLGDTVMYSTISLLALRPETGRRHQLRIHCCRAGCPVLGDRRYEGPTRFVNASGRVHSIERILLHAFATRIVLPSGTAWNPSCRVPEDFERAWLLLGGDRTALSEVSL